MKRFEVNRKELLEAVKVAMLAQRKKKTIHFEDYLLLEEWDDKITLTGTGLDTYIRAICEAIVSDPAGYYAIAVDAKQLLNITKGGAEDWVTFSVEQEQLYATCGTWKQKLTTIEAKEFPDLPIDGEMLAPIVRVEENKLIRAVKQVHVCMAEEQIRPILHGVRLHNKQEGKLNITALDGYKLANTNIVLPMHPEERFDVVIPYDTVKTLIKIMPSKSNYCVDISSEGEWISLLVSETQIVCRKIKGVEQYPDIQRFLEPIYGNKIVMTFDRKQLMEIVKRSYAVSGVNKKNTKVRFTINNSGVVFEAVGGASNIVEYDSILSNIPNCEDEFVAIYETTSLFNMLKVLDSEEVTLGFKSEFAPLQIQVDGDDAYRAILMPVRIN